MRYKRHFLIVEDDDAVMVQILEQLAEAFGRCSHLECTSSPSIACESLAYTEFDAILLDLSLTNHRGKTVVTAIRSHAPETPLFLLLDQDYQLQEIESLLEEPNGCLFKHELRERAWLRRLYATVARRNPVAMHWHNQAL
jgi:CheY-like chemotaxis protein